MAETNTNQQNQQNNNVVQSLGLGFQAGPMGFGTITEPNFGVSLTESTQTEDTTQTQQPTQQPAQQPSGMSQQTTQPQSGQQGFFSQNANQDIINMDSGKGEDFKISNQDDFVNDMSKTLQQRLIKAQQSGQQVDSQLRDQMFSEMVQGMGGRLDLQNPDVVNLRNRVMQGTLRNFQKNDWDSVYSGMQSTFERTQILGQMSNEDIAHALNSGMISYKDIRGLQVFNSEKYQEVIRLNNELKRSQSSNTVAGDADVAGTQVSTEYEDKKSFVDSLAQDYGTESMTIENSGMLAVYDEMVNSDEIKVQKDRLSDVNNRVAKLQNEKKNLYKKLENKITDKAILDAVYRDQVEDLNLELSNLLVEQSTLQSAVDAELESQKERFGIMLKEYEIDQEMELQKLGMSQKEFNAQLQIMQSNMTPEMKQLMYSQSVATQANLLGYEPNTVAAMLQHVSDISLFENQKYEIQKMDDNTALFWNPNDPTDRQVINMGPDGLQANSNAETNSFWNENNITYGLNENDHLDFDGGIRDPIRSFVSGTVTQGPTRDTKTGNISMEITTTNGDLVELNHLDKSTIGFIKEGTSISAGQVVGFIGNTGNVKDANDNWLRKDGEIINPQALKQGLGSHVDVRILKGGKGGTALTGKDAYDYIKNSARSTNILQGQAMLDVVNTIVSDSSYGAEDREFVVNSMNDALSNGDLEQARRIVIKQVTSGLTGAEKDKYDFIVEFYGKLERLDSLYKQYEAADGQLGRLNTTFSALKKSINKLDADNPRDALYIDIVNTISDMKDIITRDRTGAALSEAEQSFYAAFFPKKWSNFDYATITMDNLRGQGEITANGLLSRQMSNYEYSIMFPQGSLQYVSNIGFR